jgi:geranylgeranyl pyrophosphate synthase
MEMLGLSQKVEKVAFNVNSELRQIIDLNINDSLINNICKYAIDNICNNRDRAFIVHSIADVCNIDNESKTISYFLNASELLILAIYIKDDIIDDNSIRGGKQALHLKFGLDSAILVSDIIYSLSIKEIQKANEFLPSNKLAHVLKLHNDCYQNVCLGQIIGNNMPKELYNSEFILSHYKSLVGETYEYFCELPLSITENKDSEKIKHFAQLCGLASQIRNDFEDIAGDKEKIETELLMDIVYGRPNYIISLLLERKSSLNVQQIALLSSLFGCKNKVIISEEIRDLLFNLIVESCVLDSSLISLVSVCDEAISILNQLRDCEGKTNLINYMKYLKYE